jgi:hypothetical protein
VQDIAKMDAKNNTLVENATNEHKKHRSSAGSHQDKDEGW